MKMLKVYAYALFLFSLFSGCECWRITPSHSEATSLLTTNVSLTCSYKNSDNGLSPIDVVLKTAIYKRHENGTRNLFAYVRINNSPKAVTDNKHSFTVEGKSENPTNTFLKITWPAASQSTYGKYECDINGYAKDDSVITVTTSVVTITEMKMTVTGLLEMFLQLRQKQAETKQEFSDYIPSKKINEYYYERRVWPGGKYALPKPPSGCPDSKTTTWKEGAIKIKRQLLFHAFGNETDASKDQYAILPTCIRDSSSFGPAWPKGKYCIHRVGGSCPADFLEGQIVIPQEKNSPVMSQSSPNPDSQTSKDRVTLFFCCRNDGHPSTLIDLPSQNVFMLYRDSISCQQFAGTSYSQKYGFHMKVINDNQRNSLMKGKGLFPLYHTKTNFNGIPGDGIFSICVYKPS